jgi:hypothetical protein
MTTNTNDSAESAPAEDGKPLMLQTMERRAAHLGIGVDQLAEHDRQAIRRASGQYPTQECLSQSILQGSHPEVLQMLAHVLECPACAALVEVAAKSRNKS